MFYLSNLPCAFQSLKMQMPWAPDIDCTQQVGSRHSYSNLEVLVSMRLQSDALVVVNVLKWSKIQTENAKCTSIEPLQ